MEEINDAEGKNTGVPSPSFPNSPAIHQRRSKIEDLRMSSSFKVPHGQATVRSIHHTKTASVGSINDLKDLNVQKGLIDTAAPFESVKAAVSKFGGILDWKAHKVIAIEKSKHVESELERIEEEIPRYKSQSEAAEDAKTRVLEELDRTTRLIEELKHSLEKTETEEAEAKQDSELAQLRVREMEQGITDDASVAAKAQVEVSKARHEMAVKDLKYVKDELIALKADYHRLVTERNFAVERADEAVSAAKDIEKKAEDLMLELITTKEALESARVSHLEAEDHRIDMALTGDQDTSKIQRSWGTLLASDTEEREVIHTNIEKTKEEVERLRVAASSLKAELDHESELLATQRQREGTIAATVSSLEADLSRMQQELDLVLTKEKEAKEKLSELSNMLHRATQDADQAKSVANLAREALEKAKDEAEQAKAGASAVEARLLAALKEIEASKTSEKLALRAINTMRESKVESDATSHSNKVTLSLEDSYRLSKNAYEAEEHANERVISAIEETKDTKKSKLSNLEELEAVHRVMEEKKAALKEAKEKEAAANEGKLQAEQELRNWRAENEQRRRAVGDAAASQLPSKSSSGYLEYGSERKGFANEAEAATALRASSMRETVNYKNDEVPELKPRKKKSFFPRIVMFLARKKAQTLK